METPDGRIRWTCRNPQELSYTIGIRATEAPPRGPVYQRSPELVQQLDDIRGMQVALKAGQFEAYAGEFIAYAGGQFLDHGTNSSQLRTDCTNRAATLGVEANRILIHYIETENNPVVSGR